MDLAATPVFIAGIGNSGPEHWQARWHRRAGGVWVEHRSWDRPDRDVWVAELDDALRAVSGPRLLIAHSLGCTLVAEWAAEHQDAAVAGAFLVAPPDVHGAAFPGAASGFGAARQPRLPFRTIVVASEDDPFGSLEHATGVAECLGARLVSIGRHGHVNADSGLGGWPAGWSVLSEEFLS
jgi:predicted alpha/beta hydrolase family esterase